MTRKKPERTMESDSADLIKFAQRYMLVKAVVRFSVKKGWTTELKYCCPKHQPKLMLNSQRK